MGEAYYYGALPQTPLKKLFEGRFSQGLCPKPRLRNFLKDDLVRGAAPEPPLKKLFAKSFLRIFKNF